MKHEQGKLIVLLIATISTVFAVVSLLDLPWKSSGNFEVGLYSIKSVGIMKWFSQALHKKVLRRWTDEAWEEGISLKTLYDYSCGVDPFGSIFCSFARNAYVSGLVYVFLCSLAMFSTILGVALVWMKKEVAKWILTVPVVVHAVGFFVWVGMTEEFANFSIAGALGADSTLWQVGMFMVLGGIVSYMGLAAVGFTIEFAEDDFADGLQKAIGADQYGTLTYSPPAHRHVVGAHRHVVAANFGVFEAVA
jgi:hypothetical protein